MIRNLLKILAAIAIVGVAAVCGLMVWLGNIRTLEDYARVSGVLKQAKQEMEAEWSDGRVDYVARDNRLTIRITYSEEALAGYSDYAMVSKLKSAEPFHDVMAERLLLDMRESLQIQEISIRIVVLKSDGLTLYEKIYE